MKKLAYLLTIPCLAFFNSCNTAPYSLRVDGDSDNESNAPEVAEDLEEQHAGLTLPTASTWQSAYDAAMMINNADHHKSKAFADAYDAQTQAGKSEAWSAAYAEQRAQGQTDEEASAYADETEETRTAWGNGIWLCAYSTAIVAGRPDAVAKRYATIFEEQRRAGESIKWVAAYAKKLVIEGKQLEEARAYADEFEQGLGTIDMFSTRANQGEAEDESWDAVIYRSIVRANQPLSVAEIFTKTLREQMQAGKSLEWANAYATQIAAEQPTDFAQAFADSREAGKSHNWSEAYATQIASDHPPAAAQTYANAYEEQRLAGKSSDWSEGYANQITAGHSPAAAQTYADAYEAQQQANINLRSYVPPSPLVHAIRKNNLKSVEHLIEKGADPELADVYGKTPLMEAAEVGATTIAELLLRKVNNCSVHINIQDNTGPSVESGGKTALMYAAANGNQEMTESLLNNGAIIDLEDEAGKSALHYAQESDHLKVAAFLEAYPRIQAEDDLADLLLRAAMEGDAAMLEMLLDRGGVGINEDCKKTAFFFAVQEDQQESVKILLSKGIDTNIRDDEGSTALIEAAKEGQLEMVTLLINQNADTRLRDNKRKTALTYALENAHTEVAEKLNTETGKLHSSIQTMLNRAAANGSTEAVSRAIEAGAEPNFKDNYGFQTIIIAVVQGHQEVVELLLTKNVLLDLQDNYGKTVLMHAAEKGYTKIVTTLLQSGANPNTSHPHEKWTSLMLAAQNGYDRAIRELIQGGANVDLRDKLNKTALMYAAQNSHDRAIRELIQGGANVDLRDRLNKTALMYAAQNGHDRAIRELIQGGANPDSVENNGATALMYAASEGHLQAVKALLEEGADHNIEDCNGVTALMQASGRDHTEVALFLATRR